MAQMKPYSVVINATGMGKDTPGSPVTWEGKFPENSVAWEFNYRGELDFLHQALAQKEERNPDRRRRLGVFCLRLERGRGPGAALRADRRDFPEAGADRRGHALMNW